MCLTWTQLKTEGSYKKSIDVPILKHLKTLFDKKKAAQDNYLDVCLQII